MHNTIAAMLAILIFCGHARAQFNTISSRGNFGREITASNMQLSNNKSITKQSAAPTNIVAAESDTIKTTEPPAQSAQKRNVKKSDLWTDRKDISRTIYNRSKPGLQGKETQSKRDLPELTILNLLAEIERNGIRHPKIVLTQAILETGWFRSSVCRNKHNLFGLTNPRTKTYYELNHWTESVRAYYTKVQHRYRGGDYLLWLKKIGYAEDPGYIRAVISVLKQL